MARPSLTWRILRTIGRAFLTLIVLLSAVWVLGALTYQGPVSVVLYYVLVAAWGVLALWAIVQLWRRGVRGLALYVAAFVGVQIWWATILPSNDRIWTPEMAQDLTYERQGDTITVHNVRNFDWATLTGAVERWETRTYDLKTLTGVDIGLLYWMGPAIAHSYFEFNFADGQVLSLSVDIRKEKGEPHSSIAGIFKAYELAVTAGDEHDFMGWRVNDPNQTVTLFRTNATREEAQLLLLALLDKANALTVTPEFYHTITENCTTMLWSLTQAMEAPLPLDYRILLSGYLADYLYDLGRLNTQYSLDELRRLGSGTLPKAKAALAAGLTGPAFSTALREGVPAGR
ncbi:hypothetical protein sos41_24820 [Alphaproteobacteria bacterium SO-S41]|nr:hypothetical protein sos41_24820 [Alphaproteobacteria bacterium SO-S41]